MHNIVTNKENIPIWVTALLKEYDVFGPIRGADHLVRFQKISNPGESEWFYTGSILPPKKYFLPQEEILFTFKDGEIMEHPEESRKRVILGLHPCDLHAFKRLDLAMSDGVRDDNYAAKRERTLLIGVNCIPDSHCFCGSLGTSEAPEGGVDLFLTFVDHKVYVEPVNGNGLELLEKLPGKERVSLEEQNARESYERNRRSAFVLRLAKREGELKKLLQTCRDHPLWEDLSARCLSCGSCTTVCPTCFCFDVCDQTGLSGSEGKRVRRWDSCQTKSFTHVASGETFRKDRSERVRHRFMRKFVHLKERYGVTFCVGCGRCGRACPVKINIPDALRSLSSGEPVHGK